MANIVFIATSLDGYIADKKGSIDWLYSVPNPDNIDTGFLPLMQRIDAIVMGRNTLDVVLGFDVEWPYSRPVFVLSNAMKSVPTGYEDKVFLLNGELKSIIKNLNEQGYKNLYIDGGVTISHFLREDLIDEITITQFPILLGGGARLFGELEKPLQFSVIKTDILLGQLVQTTYKRTK